MTEPDALLTRDRLAADLSAIGLCRGDTVMIHAAMRMVGALLNGPDALIDAIRTVVGDDGTVMAYTDWDSPHDDLTDEAGHVLPQWRAHVPAFDPGRSRAARRNGAIVEFLRTTPGALRSANPGASCVAIGRLADWLTRDHPIDYGYGPGSPLARLVETDGRVLMIGAPWDTMTLVHHADHLADLPGKAIVRLETPFATADGVQWRMIEEYDTTEPVIDGLPEDYIERIVTDFVAGGGGRQGLIGHAPSLLVDARPMLAFAINWLEDRARE
ncbi:aminoglycoside 3-N-acetyltransferase [Sphingomonas sp. 1P06PA]|uniref:aminoglycoside 3-N-acetyltransferase n=1 Tax=Sphingomonas sp. 1P06PA TaxID=554121 RepID=UPI0039A61D77